MTNLDRLRHATEYELAKVLIAEELLALEYLSDIAEEGGDIEIADAVRSALFNENTVNKAILEKMEWLKQEAQCTSG